MDLNEMTNQFKTLWQTVQRPGVDKLLAWLENHTDFYVAPASTRHHLARRGGLLEHSLNVYHCLRANAERLCPNTFRADSLVICGLGHDLCKVNYYVEDVRNVKRDGVWVQEPCYVVKDQMPMGHGEKSVFILQRFITLLPGEALAIRWHMAGWTDGAGNYATRAAMSEAARLTPLVPLLWISDIEATQIKERDA
ncbi:MAG: hydrolase [Bacillota bacterium]|nr:hydrolase [Bacillota bacterium]